MKAILISILFFYSGSIWARELSLAEALQISERTSPELKLGQEREVQAEENLKIAKSGLYPSFELSAVQSYGFPGSSSPTPNQFGGILNSAYRSGPGLALLGKMSLLDLAKWESVNSAKWGKSSTQEQTKQNRILVLQNTLRDYLETSKFRGEVEIWKEIFEKMAKLSQASQKMVRTGQASDVSGLLIQDQANEVQMNLLIAQEKYQQGLRKMSINLQMKDQEISCPLPSSLNAEVLKNHSQNSKSPQVINLEMQIEEAKSKSSQASKQNYPQLFLVASAGYIEDSRLVDKQNYSAWVGVTIPLFEGFRISAETQKALSLVREKESQLQATQMELDQTHRQFEEMIHLAELKISLLSSQREPARKSFETARKRYLTFIGPVVEVRESLRNLARVETQINSAQIELIYAKSSQALWKGGSLTPP